MRVFVSPLVENLVYRSCQDTRRPKKTPVFFPKVHFVMYAQSYGANGHQVEKTDDFAPLLERCFVEGGVHLIDLPVDYWENNKVLIDELKEKVCLI